MLALAKASPKPVDTAVSIECSLWAVSEMLHRGMRKSEIQVKQSGTGR